MIAITKTTNERLRSSTAAHNWLQLTTAARLHPLLPSEGAHCLGAPGYA